MQICIVFLQNNYILIATKAAA